MDLKPLPKEDYLYLQAPGIDIALCRLDYSLISVRCEDLSLYKKAFRVKIRALIKEKRFQELQAYVNAFYTLAHFVRHLYGFHSCDSGVEFWQEKLAQSLKTSFIPDHILAYQSDTWIVYQKRNNYQEMFTQKYMDVFSKEKVKLDTFVQDEKPFLNPKDKSHFDKIFTQKEKS